MNEKNFIRSYTGTTWLAYDSDQQPLLLNKNYNLLLLKKHAKKGKFEVLVTPTKRYETYESVYIKFHMSFVLVICTKHILQFVRTCKRFNTYPTGKFESYIV